jgi:hypothetical protein
MNIVRTLVLSALGIGAMAFATPSHAADRVIVKERTYISNGHRYHHHRHDWERERHGRVIVHDNSGVSVAFGGHPRHHRHHYYHRDWDRR